MIIEIFGPGCTKCNNLEKIVKATINEIGLEVELKKISDLNEMVNRGVMLTPALFINGKKKSEGKVPSIDEIKKWLKGE